ncbi:FUSC family protein [Rhodanobacter sp. AS-Z3]|uniref:FUSC family protein n=1 Tax=Rhodanobacter sp. AS-Z3 TaxID=3031330 RepID=UPI0024796231|nr:FUSC family protein [Rhodanobacter sp. AS-Z3]WEN16674.1 FUSC family protein [Rhodanobacter sp. AS-Z3]
MPPNDYSLRAHAIESLTRFKRPDVPWRVVIRNTAAVVLPLGIGMATGHPQIGLGVGAGALNTMFSDQPGPYRQRLRQLLLAALAAALASLIGFLIGGNLLPLLLATAICGFAGGLLVVFGTDTARVGMTSMILLMVTASTPTTLDNALGSAALIFGGGLLLASFSLVGWPLQRYWPERQALVVVYRGLSALARETRHDEADAPALSEAMTTLQQTLLGRHHAHGRAMEAFRVLLELAERIRLELTAMIELDDAVALPSSFRDDAGGVLQSIADAMEDGDSPEQAARLLLTLRAHAPSITATHGSPSEPSTRDGRSAHVQALIGQIAAAVRNADWAGSRGELRASAAETHLPSTLRGSAPWALLRASLTPRSVAFRHAVRMAVCLSGTLALSRLLDLPHGYWLPMTAAIVLRADFASTFNFGLLRVLGTVLGLVLTTVLLYITPAQPWAHLALMAVLCMAFRYLAGAHYGIAVAALTGTVVILLSFEGVAPAAAVADRVINTALGCGIALLAYVVWPTWERGRARAALTTMLDAYADYLRVLVSPNSHARNETRSAARTARVNAQASMERMRSEPATPPALLALARTLFANGNRLARTAMTLEAMIDDLAGSPAQAEARDFVEHCASTLQVISATLRGGPVMPEMPDLRARQLQLAKDVQASTDTSAAELLVRISDRLVDNIDTLAHVVKRSRQQASTDDYGVPI